ncbi:hypothetical protein RRG08_037406 [Elysia crispata]|uniref:Uncharacterized protein n=1 Tax=Elysia crispata TaxID=231223 RepID=A0AAE1AH17_9GAST|nr:hypothetical protein RRG08_037406 [Elysia crispata]
MREWRVASGSRAWAGSNPPAVSVRMFYGSCSGGTYATLASAYRLMGAPLASGAIRLQEASVVTCPQFQLNPPYNLERDAGDAKQIKTAPYGWDCSLFLLSTGTSCHLSLSLSGNTVTRQSSAPSTSSVTSPTHRPPSESISLHREKTEGHKPERAQASQAERLSQGRGRCHASRGSPAPDDVLTRSYVVRAPRPTSR